MMSKQQAETLGRTAFTNGHGPHPFADPAILAECKDAKPGEKTHILKAWSHGWQRANLDAPVI